MISSLRLACIVLGLAALVNPPAAIGQVGASSISLTNCPPADGPPADLTYPLRKQAFEAIEHHDSALARRLMRCAIQKDPHDRIALRQEVYLDLDAGDGPGAIGDIDTLRTLGATDSQLEAQEGYIYAEKKNYAQAKAAFRRAIETGDNDIRLQAMQALRNISTEDTTRSLSFNLDSQYLNRFDDGVVDASAHFNQRLGRKSPFQAYLNARLLRDTASQVGPLPQIFDDNAFLGGVGLAFQPAAAHYSISAEANEAYTLYAGRNHTAAAVPDYRVVAGYYNVFRPGPLKSVSQRFSFEANGSIGFYSRYQHDMIVYLQPQESFDLLRSGGIRLAPYLQESFAFDSNQQYYNNIAELIPGIEVYLQRLSGLALRTEYVLGYYLPFANSSANSYGSNYHDFRIRLTWSKTLPLHTGGE